MSDDRKVACLGMPTYGDLTVAAAKGFYRPSRGGLMVYPADANDARLGQVELQCQQSSLLALNCNILWCWVLNKVHRGERVDYFAMQHADIEPQEFWLDELVNELETHNLDVLGVVAPIKDVRGVTSVALGSKDGNNWRPAGRLTMREIFRLPETFTSDDLHGHRLLINTGIWVCKWNQEWCKKVHFTINDRICFDPEKETYFAQVEPEDWFFSSLLHELGLRVGCTRKVKIGHRGPMQFANTEPWGSQSHDTEYLQRSILDGEDAADWFPHYAAGWLTEAEGKELARLATDRAVLEIGSYCGRSTICLAQKAKSVGAVDTFDARGTPNPGDTLKTFKRNLIRYNVASRVNILQGTSEEMLPNLPPIFDLVFIDGSHDRESVQKDIELSLGVLRRDVDSLIVFHDYARKDEDLEVTQAVNEFLADGAELIGQCESLAIVRPSAEQLSRAKLEPMPA